MVKEIWKEYPLNYDYEGEYRVEVSNKGQVKAYNSANPDGKIVKGSLQGGFPIVRIKLFKKRSEIDAQKVENLNKRILALNAEIKKLRNQSTSEKRKMLQAERDELVQKRMKHNQRIDKKRCINVAILKHKAVAELFMKAPDDEDKKFIIHKDFDKENNAVENLEWATQEELNSRYMKHPKNVLFAFKKQFMETKPNTGASKLSEKDVLMIKLRLKKGDSLKKLAARFNVSDMQIHRIKSGENWSHVKLVEDLVEEKRNKKWQAT